MKITHVCTAEEDQKTQTSWVTLNSQGRDGPMKQREDHAEAIRKKSACGDNLEKQGQKSIPANKHGKEQINRSQDPVKEPTELTRRPDGNGILLPPHQAHLRHGGNHQTKWWQAWSFDEQ